MKIVRPDQFRYEQFCRHLEQIDGLLEVFASRHKFEIRKNFHRQPSRDLRRSIPTTSCEDNLHGEFIGIYLSNHWRYANWEDDMLHDAGVAVYYPAPPGKRLYKNAAIVEKQPFSLIQKNLGQILEECLGLIDSWIPPVLSEDDPDAALQGWRRTMS